LIERYIRLTQKEAEVARKSRDPLPIALVCIAQIDGARPLCYVETAARRDQRALIMGLLNGEITCASPDKI
jgi:hypothetical protein